ncbi:unnamed protein product [Mytilus edulis]|uniref:LRAT domain-containing protein n=1 Tax=Mytilus edulis TaxID=6550 RepID=A0A8S3V5K5_MYTED|nr:unnamed protein product [Mytilus edulis]
MASNIDKRELNLQSKQGPIDNVEEDVQLIPPEETTIVSYEAFKELVNDYSHLRVVRHKCCRSYSHHFLVTNIKSNKEIIDVTIVHYTSSCDIFTERKSMAVGKFKSETFKLGDELAKDLLDFDTGVYLISHPDVGEDNDVQKRIYERLGEREYDFGWNNCEHIINYILSGTNNPSRERISCVDCCNPIANMKEVGLKTAVLVAFFGAIASSVTRFCYVSLLAASLIFMNANISSPEICDDIVGQNAIKEAKKAINDAMNLPFFPEIENSSTILADVISGLDDKLICYLAKHLHQKVVRRTCEFGFSAAVSLETIFLFLNLFFSLCPLRKTILRNDVFCRIMFVKIFSGYLSITLAIGAGVIGQFYLTPPDVWFFIIAFVACILFRFLLTWFTGCLFDLCCCCHCVESRGCCYYCEGGCQLTYVFSFVFITLLFLVGMFYYALDVLA